MPIELSLQCLRIGRVASVLCAVVGISSGCGDDVGMQETQGLTPPDGALLAMSSALHDTTPDADATDVTALADDNRAFAFALGAEVGKTSGNWFFSPYSISTALAMAYAGARANTAAEMKTALHFGDDSTKLHAAFNATAQELAGRETEPTSVSGGDPFELDIVNQAWGDKQTTFEASYLDALAINYGAGLFLVDFAGNADGARKIINGWVAERTKDRIHDLLGAGSVDTTTALVLTNAVYFKASWASKFDASKTDSAMFHTEAGDQPTRMMHQVVEAEYAESADYQAVALPYVTDAVRMLLLLPEQGRFEAVSGTLASAFDSARRGLDNRRVTLSMPKFSFTSKPELVMPLEALGMHDAFTSAADFSGIDGGHDLHIQDVVHQAFVAVDESGTEAAAATAVIIGKASAPEPASLTLDRPFFFFVYDEATGEILFMGRLVEPTTQP